MAQNEDTNSIRQQIVDNRETSQGGTAVDNTDLSARPTGTPATGLKSTKELATDITNEYGEPLYIDGRLNTGAPQKEGAGANERLARGTYHNPTPQEVERQEKEYRNKRFWAALNDGIASLSNLFFTTRYAPNSFDPNNLASTKVRERYDKLKKDRDDQKDKWFNAVMQGRKMDDDLEAGKRASRLAYYQQQQAAKDAAENRRQQDFQFKANLAWQKENAANQNQLARDKMAQDEKFHKDNLNVQWYNAKNKGGGSGSGGSGQYMALDRNGKEHNFTSSADALDFAKREGTAIYAPKREKTVNDDGESTYKYEEGWYPANRLEDLSDEQRAIHRTLIPNLRYGDEDENGNRIVNYVPQQNE